MLSQLVVVSNLVKNSVNGCGGAALSAAAAWHLHFGYMERFEEHLRFGKSAAEAVHRLTGR